MFILSKEIMKDIAKYREDWQECIKNEDSLSALTSFFLVSIFILLIINFFILDIIFFPLETIIYLKFRKVRK